MMLEFSGNENKFKFFISNISYIYSTLSKMIDLADKTWVITFGNGGHIAKNRFLNLVKTLKEVRAALRYLQW